MSKTKTKTNEGPAVIILRLYDISPKTFDAAIKREGYANRNEWFRIQVAKVTGTKTTAEKTGERRSIPKLPKAKKAPRKAAKEPKRAKPAETPTEEPKAQEAAQGA